MEAEGHWRMVKREAEARRVSPAELLSSALRSCSGRFRATQASILVLIPSPRNRAWTAPGRFCFLFQTLPGPFLIVDLAGLRLGLAGAPVLCRFLMSHLSDLHSMTSWRFGSWWEAWQAQQWGQDSALPHGQGTKLIVRSAFAWRCLSG